MFTARLIALLLLSPAAAVAAPADPYAGTWVLSPAQSTGGPKAQVLSVEVDGMLESYRSELVAGGQVRQVTTYSARYDGLEYPSRTEIIGPDGTVREVRSGGVILHRTDLLRRERHWKQDGRVFRVLRRVVDETGTTMTSQLVEIGPDGSETPGGVLVFHRR